MFTPNQLPIAEEQTCLTTDHGGGNRLILHAAHVGVPVIIESSRHRFSCYGNIPQQKGQFSIGHLDWEQREEKVGGCH